MWFPFSVCGEMRRKRAIAYTAQDRFSSMEEGFTVDKTGGGTCWDGRFFLCPREKFWALGRGRMESSIKGEGQSRG